MSEELKPEGTPEPSSPPSNGNGLPHDWSSQVRQVLAGFIGVAIACFDRWKFPDPEKGFSTNIDEIVLLVSLGVIAGAAGLFRLPGHK